MYRLAAILWLMGGMFVSALSAQEITERRPDFEFVRAAEPWFSGYNAAGLYKFSLDNISVAEVLFHKDNGKFINYFHSDNSYQLGASAESFYRLGSKTVLYGKVSYSRFEGKNMGGSCFIDPDNAPFDLVEYADSTAGTKQMERYHLVGALSFELTEKLRLGGKVDYRAANYAKFKDLRHKNKLMDMSLTLGASYSIGAAVEIGANYFYRRSAEGVELRSYGNKDQQFYSLVGFGAFYGRREIFGDSGYTESNDEKPLFNEFHGGSLQLQLNFSPLMKFFNEFTYKSRDGYYGKRSPSTIVFTGHNSDIFEYDGIFSMESARNLHLIRFSAFRENLENNENVYKKENTSGNVQNIVYYGSNKALDRELLDLKLEYTAHLDVADFHPAWILKAGAAFWERSQTASVYPYFRKQTVQTMQFDVSGQRNIFSNSHIFSIRANAGFGAGNGTAKEDGSYTPGSDDGSNPASLDTYLYREFEFLTASRLQAGAGFGYSRPINKNLAIYAEINYRFTKAFDLEHLKGDTFGQFSAKIGCLF